MNKIEIYRRKANLTQEELAKKAGVDRAYLSTIETGKANISLKTLNKLAAALSCTAAELI